MRDTRHSIPSADIQRAHKTFRFSIPEVFFASFAPLR
jgi:hypothetical protein